MEEGEGVSDPWLGIDKLYHLLMSFFLTFLFYAFASLTRYRRHAISIGSLLSLFAGAAKEAADHLGYFRSSGASLRDALANILGVCIASFALSLFPFSLRSPPPSHTRALSLV
ncbi:hypothetical protein LR48_Vigan05g226400 [Vigna angularis]|uniref:Uncharacterized protein n=2 Tax=Phaseolus angularis TaxID=3914 RepID=A0A0L9UQ51_PHAAN|nr:uncharacterized protein LOC108333462 [Vigna angularis]XP_017424404.1 uncharacterized protein LOC108333462 [Vigna angularis]KAG2370965.1 uncharacterized protein HKW66_Vig0211390 [Vigna angularis]KOM44659.1 hypothetical protein LR48_Vigan05g226400 [Vigna angularis]BAT91449.1 hypothetical protein VIGAN_07004600 [Vigna angularis var. angularis]